MGPGICEIHGVQNYTLTSPSIAAAIAGDGSQGFQVATFETFSYNANHQYFVDKEFLRENSVLENSVLVDKDKSLNN